ncbi:MAG: hypothetical protein J6E44_10365, partial [Lachnospiraceae bacterium]|nr:hypothetical protein [Lachnospiraceae bacterium]
EGRNASEKETEEREEAVRSFQVVSGEMFTRVNEPVLRINRNGLAFSAGCIPKMDCSFAEILFNPVERMMVARPYYSEDEPNAVPWRPGDISAIPVAHMLYDTMGWDAEYTYRVPCRTIREPGGSGVVLAFDFDNYIGRAANKKEEVIMARKEAALAEEKREDAKSYFYPPEDDEEPQEIYDIEERFRKAREQNRKIFGEPVFRHEESFRGFEDTSGSGKWDMLMEAKPIDIDHRVDEEQVENLFLEIMDDPPVLPQTPAPREDVIDASSTENVINVDDGEEG